MRTRALLIVCGLFGLAWLVLAAEPGAAQPPPLDPRFGIVEAYVNSQAATEAGAGYTRVILRWDVIEPGGPGDWKPANVPDPFIEEELAAGRELVAILIGTPDWAANDGSGSPKAVPDMGAWDSFVRRVARQYQGRIRHWVIWNEPDVWDMDHPGSTWAGTEEEYYHLLKTAYLAIKDVDPDMQVHMAGLTYFWDREYDRRQYLDRMLDIIVADPDAAAHGYYFDAVVYHLYYNPYQAPLIIREAHDILGGHGVMAKEIWVNETNAPPSDDEQSGLVSSPLFPVSLQEQSTFVIQEYALAFAAGANRVEFYKLRDSHDRAPDSLPFGMLRADDSRRPVFDSYKVMTENLSGFRSVQEERFGDVQAVTFDRGETSTTVLWTNSRQASTFVINAIAAQATLVDEQGNTTTLTAEGGTYTIELPGAVCSDTGNCFIGGAPRLLVETGSPGQRPGLVPIASAVPTPPEELATPVPTSVPSPILILDPISTMAPTALPTSTPIPVSTAPLPTPQPLPTPLPPVNLGTVLNSTRCLVLGLAGLVIFIVSYGLQATIWRRWKS